MDARRRNVPPGGVQVREPACPPGESVFIIVNQVGDGWIVDRGETSAIHNNPTCVDPAEP